MRARCDGVLSALRAVSPPGSEPVTPESLPPTPTRRRSSQPNPQAILATQPQPIRSWNEYDDGSEAGGDSDESYAIYVMPDDDDAGFLGLSRLRELLAMPLAKAKAWIGVSRHESQPLLSAGDGASPHRYGATDVSYFAQSPGVPPASPTVGRLTDAEDMDDEEAFASDADYPTSGYIQYRAALPSISDQKMIRDREHSYFWGMVLSYATSFLVLGLAAVSFATGRHKERLQVDASASLGVVASFFFACLALGLNMARGDRLGLAHSLAVWTTFATVCILNGFLLVLVVGSAAL